MNRKKKLNSILDKRIKKMNAKKSTTHKVKYISKAERAKLEAQEYELVLENEVTTAE
ncbi:DUF2986 domain-containing protein [Psychromonas antarctica]|uniref:DUF2986 domain-containing protein n=1 Tax=Psychromonas antarctica TaxID=67573 RepID=UPI001EE880BE|nr:DUF2986 domain-containing protein [Psychromonas antarctica]MCG6200663.1 DUF2986 domain-containing protein [Psychromonas antarctica]